MAKETNGTKWNILVMICVGLIGMGSTQVDRLTGRGEDAGIKQAQVDQNTKDIHTHHEDGCKPSIEVRKDQIKQDGEIEKNAIEIARNDAAITKMDKKLDEILEILRPIQPPQP